MIRRFPLFARILLLVGCLAPYAAAQEADSPTGQQSSAGRSPGNFDDLHQQWNATDAALDQLANDYRQAKDVESRRQILAQYQQRVVEGEAVLAQLRESALAEYRQAPNARPEVTQVLMGVLADALRRDRYDQAAEVAELLLKNNCPEPSLADLAGRVAYCRDEFASAKELLQRAQQAKSLSDEGQTMLEDVDTAIERWRRESKLRAREAADDDLPRVSLETNKGRVVIELLENEAPQTVANFISLVEKKFYDGLSFHRVLPGFMAQGGCPAGTGSGGPGYTIYCECVEDDHRHHFRGSLSMAHAGRDTGGSQFFLTFRRTPHLDGKHTVFGRVVEGLDVLPALQRRNPQMARGVPTADRIIKAEVIRKRPHEYVPTKVAER